MTRVSSGGHRHVDAYLFLSATMEAEGWRQRVKELSSRLTKLRAAARAVVFAPTDADRVEATRLLAMTLDVPLDKPKP